MEIQLNKIFKILWLLLFFMTCKGQDDKPTKQQEKKHTKENKIDFLDKKYFSLYSLDANNKIPTMSYYDKKIGQFTLYYLGKNKELQQLWDNFDSKNNLTYEEAPDQNYYNNLNKLISQKLNISNYDIFSEYITPQYLKIEKDELLYSYPLIKKIYKYQKEKHKWLLIKEEKIVSNTNIITLNYLNKLNNTQNLIDQDDYETTVDTDKKYQTILLYKYLKNGINKNNIKDISTVENIETVIGNYILQKDFYKPSFFERESKIIDNSISEEQLKIWLTCNEKVNFIDVVNENILFDDWNYPYKKITSMKDIADLYKYKNEEYGHTYKVDALPQQMALYMYFLPWKEREKVYKEIDALKKQLQKNKND